MNKYHEALSRLYSNLNIYSFYYVSDKCDDDYDLLFEILEKYQNLQDENARLSFDKIVNNIEDMNYKLWLENPPLKWEELKVGMWVWDSRRKCLLKITRVEIDKWYRHFVHHYYDINMNETTRTLFEENRYFRKQVE